MLDSSQGSRGAAATRPFANRELARHWALPPDRPRDLPRVEVFRRGSGRKPSRFQDSSSVSFNELLYQPTFLPQNPFGKQAQQYKSKQHRRVEDRLAVFEHARDALDLEGLRDLVDL